MNDSLVFIFSIGIVLAMALELLLGLYSYQIGQGRHYSFWNELPFELAQGAHRTFIPIHYALTFLFAALWAVLPPLIFYKSVSNFYYLIVLVISWAITGMTICGMFVINFNNIKRHLLLLSVLFVSTLVDSIVLAIMFHSGAHGYPYFSYHSNFLSYIQLLPGALTLVLIFNPKMKKWPIMDKIIRQDGSIEILRPRHFFLAYSEWALIGINLLQLIIFDIALVIAF